MVSAADMKKRSVNGAYDNIMYEIGKCADAGMTEINVGDYDHLSMGNDVVARLESEGYTVDGTKISWG